MLKKLALDKSKSFEKHLALQEIAKMLVEYIKGDPYYIEIGAEQGDIPTWDDFVILTKKSTNIYIQAKRQTTSFSANELYKVVRDTYINKKGVEMLRKLSPFDHTLQSLAEVMLDNQHDSDEFWIYLPEDNVSIKNEISIRDLRKFKESIKDVTEGKDMERLASADPQTKNVYFWLSTWCSFEDWDHIVKAFKRLSIKTTGYETDILERAKEKLREIFISSEMKTICNKIFYYMDSNSTYAGAFRPRQLLFELKDYLLPVINRWTLFKTNGYSWEISGINNLESNGIETPEKIVSAFWHNTDVSMNDLKVCGKYSENCKIVKGLMRLSVHSKGRDFTSVSNCEKWKGDIRKFVGGTLGVNEDDFEDLKFISLNEELSSIIDSKELKSSVEKEEYAKQLNNKMDKITLEYVNEKILNRLESMESSELKNKIEKCWFDWYKKLNNDVVKQKELFENILHPEVEGPAISGEMRIGCKTAELITNAIFLTMVVAIALGEDSSYDWRHLQNSLSMKAIGLKYWSGPADSLKKVIEIDEYKAVKQLLEHETEEVVILSGTKAPVSDLLEVDLAGNSANNGYLSDRKQPKLLITFDTKLRRLINQGNIKDIQSYFQHQIDVYIGNIDKSIKLIVGDENEI